MHVQDFKVLLYTVLYMSLWDLEIAHTHFSRELAAVQSLGLCRTLILAESDKIDIRNV